MKLIDKDALVAWLLEELKLAEKFYKETKSDVYFGKINLLKKQLSFLNTLEVREVDLEHEIESYWKQCDMTWCRDAYSMTHTRSMLSDIAKHFYELGVAACNKVQKGE